MANPTVLLETTSGDILIELYADKAPATVENFLKYVNEGFYANTIFHRVIKGFMIQGGGMNMNMIKQAQKMQQDMLKMQEELEVKQYEAAAGGGVVKAVVNGKHEVVSLTIDPEAVDPEDVEMLQDMVVAAVNEAMRKAEAEASQNMSRLTGGLNLGGLF